MLQNTYAKCPTCEAALIEAIKDYQFYDNIPKHKMFVKLADGISADKQNEVVNGLRNKLGSGNRTIVMFQLRDIKEATETFRVIFEIFVALIGAIALIISFFLLLTSTTQNITEAVWEYGVLRSVGLTMAEGKRIFMYENFLVMATSGLLGIIVGLITILMVTTQFYLFIELNWEIEFPWWLFLCMFVTSIATTWLSVEIPMKSVNKKPIAAALKASGQ